MAVKKMFREWRKCASDKQTVSYNDPFPTLNCFSQSILTQQQEIHENSHHSLDCGKLAWRWVELTKQRWRRQPRDTGAHCITLVPFTMPSANYEDVIKEICVYDR